MVWSHSHYSQAGLSLPCKDYTTHNPPPPTSSSGRKEPLQLSGGIKMCSKERSGASGGLVIVLAEPQAPGPG